MGQLSLEASTSDRKSAIFENPSEDFVAQQGVSRCPAVDINEVTIDGGFS